MGLSKYAEELIREDVEKMDEAYMVGPGHCVFADHNLSDSHLESCIKQCLDPSDWYEPWYECWGGTREDAQANQLIVAETARKLLSIPFHNRTLCLTLGEFIQATKHLPDDTPLLTWDHWEAFRESAIIVPVVDIHTDDRGIILSLDYDNCEE